MIKSESKISLCRTDRRTLSLLELKMTFTFTRIKDLSPHVMIAVWRRGPEVKCCMVTWRAGEGSNIEHSFGNIDIILYYLDS